MGDCPLCRLAALGSKAALGDVHTIDCTRCGSYTITDAACVLLQSLPPRFLIAMSRAVHAAKDTLHITVQNVPQLVAPFL